MDWGRLSGLSLHNKLRLLNFTVKLLVEEGKATLEDRQWAAVARAIATRIRRAAVALAA